MLGHSIMNENDDMRRESGPVVSALPPPTIQDLGAVSDLLIMAMVNDEMPTAEELLARLAERTPEFPMARHGLNRVARALESMATGTRAQPARPAQSGVAQEYLLPAALQKSGLRWQSRYPVGDTAFIGGPHPGPARTALPKRRGGGVPPCRRTPQGGILRKRSST